MFLDRERDGAFEAGRREDVARMARIGEPSHDRAETLRHTSGWVVDAVVIGQEKPHGPSVQTEERGVNNPEARISERR
jgi:hypothetical protein